MKVLIVEDEIKTARELKDILESAGFGIQVSAMLPSVFETVDWLRNNPSPDLIFSDIQLADGLGFDIFKQTRITVPVVFCTAFDEYAIKAFEVNGIDYLLKPLEENRVLQSLEKYARLKNNFAATAGYAQKLEGLFNAMPKPYRQSLLVFFKDQVLPLKTADIRFIHYATGHIRVYTADRKSYSMTTSMDDMEQQLDPALFFRANRQFIVSRQAVAKAEQYFARKLVILLHDPVPEPIVVSKARAGQFIKWLGDY